MTDRPLHIYDLTPQPDREKHPALGDHWYWCRSHGRAEHSNWAMVGCLRVGPFMDENEAKGAGKGLGDAVVAAAWKKNVRPDSGVLSQILRQEAEASVALDKGDGQTFVVDDVSDVLAREAHK